MALVREHFIFRAAGAFPLLAADLLDLFLAGAFSGMSEPVYFLQKQTPCEKPVQTLGTFSLAAYFETCGNVPEHDAGGYFIHILPARTAGMDEIFLKIRFAERQLAHLPFEFFYFSWGNRVNGRVHLLGRGMKTFSR